MESQFGKNIRKIRLAKGFTLKQLAEKLGVSHQSVEKWEKGITMPTGKRLLLLAEVLEVTQNQLYETEKSEELDTVVISKLDYDRFQQALTRENELLRELAELRKEKIKDLEAEKIRGGSPLKNPAPIPS